MSVTAKVEICNLALGHLGNYGTVNDIDTPTNDKEIICAQWYDITRQNLLKTVMPNFALARKLVAELVTTIPFGYDNCFEYPSDCLKVLGLGNLADRADYTYSIEKHPTGFGKVIYTDDEWAAGMQIRYIKDVENVNSMSPEFKLLLSWELAGNIALPITQSPEKKAYIEKLLPMKRSELSGLSAQENRPIRISHSRFRAARHYDQSRNPTKK